MSAFFVGGTVKLGAPSYVGRQSDTDLYDAVLAGEYCTILTARQMGKSSLMARTAARLREGKIACATVDLQGKGDRNTPPDQWYYGVAKQIADGLELFPTWSDWWKQQDLLPPAQRFTDLFADVILMHIPGPVVVFLDEIDWTIDLPYSDEFFAAIRSCYNRRAQDGHFTRLTFVLLGSASPAQLIKSTTRTPFNIGRGIELTDFRCDEAKVFATLLGEDGLQLVTRILHWTDGHPYLTQMVCQKVVEVNQTGKEPATVVDSVVRDTLLSTRALHQENNLKFVSDRLTKNTADLPKVLRVYGDVLRGRRIENIPTSPVHISLRLSGVVKPDADGHLRVRNRIYRTVFDEAWVRDKLGIQTWPALVDAFSQWLQTTLRDFVSGYNRRYAKVVFHRHRTFDIKGLSTQGNFALDLEAVYVDSAITPTPVQTIAYDPLRPPKAAEPADRSIFAWLKGGQDGFRNLAIVGPPGSGKTTLLKHVALTLASREVSAKRTPVLLFLREHVSAITSNPEITLAEVITSSLREVPPPSGWFARRLKSGECLVMFDGIDEVVDAERRHDIVRWIERQTESLGGNCFVVSSRPSGYRDYPLAGFTVLQILPFGDAQIERFVRNWYLANEIMSHQANNAGVRMDAARGAENLLSHIRSSTTLQDLAINPLLLTMIATVHRYRSQLPGRRVELYAEICDVFLGKRQQAKGLALDLTAAQKVRVLRVLAYEMMNLTVREISAAKAAAAIAPTLRLVTTNDEPAAFLQMIEDSSAIVVQRESGVYAFSHLVFQEYLASLHIKEERELLDQLILQVESTWWYETIRLYAAQADASPIVEKCLAPERPSIQALLLAIDCEAEALGLSSELRNRLRRVMEEAAEDPDPARRHLAAEYMSARGSVDDRNSRYR